MQQLSTMGELLILKIASCGGSIVLFCRSPLLFGLSMKEKFGILNSYKFQSKDYQITTDSVWNYALRLSNDDKPDQDLKVVSSGLEIGVPPFSLRGAPTMILAQVIVLSYYTTANN